MIPNPRPLMEQMDGLSLSEAHSLLKAVRQGRLHHLSKLPDKQFVQRTVTEKSLRARADALVTECVSVLNQSV